MERESNERSYEVEGKGRGTESMQGGVRDRQQWRDEPKDENDDTTQNNRSH